MPGTPTGAEQAREESKDEAAAAAGRTSPQASERSAQQKQEFYWKRQAEKLEKELAAARGEREAELSRLSRDRDEAAARAAEAEWRAQRLKLVAEAGLSPELQALVPEADPETVASYVEKLRPIAEKLARPHPRGLTNTNPPNPAGNDDARLQRLGQDAARGDRRALREYSHLRERL
jgi:hypothetical protein